MKNDEHKLCLECNIIALINDNIKQLHKAIKERLNEQLKKKEKLLAGKDFESMDEDEKGKTAKAIKEYVKTAGMYQAIEIFQDGVRFLLYPKIHGILKDYSTLLKEDFKFYCDSHSQEVALHTELKEKARELSLNPNLNSDTVAEEMRKILKKYSVDKGSKVEVVVNHIKKGE